MLTTEIVIIEMKNLVKKLLLLVAVSLVSVTAALAQEAPKAVARIAEIVAKYEKTEGVSTMVAAKGSGIALMKMMLKDQFGKMFMKGVTNISMINYSEASAEVCESLHADSETLGTLLDEVDLSDSDGTQEFDYARNYISVASETTLSDFVIAIEMGESKMMIYMAGSIQIKE